MRYESDDYYLAHSVGSMYDDDYLAHSWGPWKEHKYIKKVGEGANAVYTYARDTASKVAGAASRTASAAAATYRAGGARDTARYLGERAGYAGQLAKKKVDPAISKLSSGAKVAGGYLGNKASQAGAAVRSAANKPTAFARGKLERHGLINPKTGKSYASEEIAKLPGKARDLKDRGKMIVGRMLDDAKTKARYIKENPKAYAKAALASVKSNLKYKDPLSRIGINKYEQNYLPGELQFKSAKYKVNKKLDEIKENRRRKKLAKDKARLHEANMEAKAARENDRSANTIPITDPKGAYNANSNGALSWDPRAYGNKLREAKKKKEQEKERLRQWRLSHL